jgi:predicted dehydrogenase
MSIEKIRFGILGAANIVSKALIQPANLNSNVEIIAIASRDKEKALDIAKSNNIPNVYDHIYSITQFATYRIYCKSCQ